MAGQTVSTSEELLKEFKKVMDEDYQSCRSDPSDDHSDFQLFVKSQRLSLCRMVYVLPEGSNERKEVLVRIKEILEGCGYNLLKIWRDSDHSPLLVSEMAIQEFRKRSSEGK
jgi:hypothetical protein